MQTPTETPRSNIHPVSRPARTVTISAREHARLRRAEHYATFDELTGVLTRFGLRELFRPIRRDFMAGRKPAFGLVVIDLQDFKGLNDRRGQERGDEALADFGRQLRAAVKSSDLVARVGGDEFLIVLKGISDQRVLERVKQRLRGPYVLQSGRRRIRFKAYVVGKVSTAHNVGHLESTAFRLLVRAKHAHKKQAQLERAEPIRESIISSEGDGSVKKNEGAE